MLPLRSRAHPPGAGLPPAAPWQRFPQLPAAGSP